MAYPVELTIGTGNKVTVNYQSKEVSVSLTYQLDRTDHDVLALAREKSKEVVAVHNAAWERVRANTPSQHEPKEVKHQPIPRENNTGEIGAANDSAHENSETGQDEAKASLASGEKAEPSINDAKSVLARNRACSSPAPLGPTSSMVGQHLALRALLAQSGILQQEMDEILATHFECDSLEDLSYDQASGWLLQLQKTERERVRSHQDRSVRSDKQSG